jgi:hypothetical protein
MVTSDTHTHPWKQHLGTKFVYNHWRSADTGPFLNLFVQDLVTLILFINLLINDEGHGTKAAAVSEHKSIHELRAVLSTEMTLTFYNNYTALVCNNCVSHVSKCYTKYCTFINQSS